MRKQNLYSFFISLLLLSLVSIQGECYGQSQAWSSYSNNCEFCSRFWVDAEYLYWKIKDSPKSVPLVATAPVIEDNAPVIGQPGASVVLGGKKIQNDWRSGGKFTVGTWFDEEDCFGAEAIYFFLPTESKKHQVFSSGEPGSRYLAVPFFDAVTGSESSSPLATPNNFRGLAKLNVSNFMQGAELNGLASLYSDCTYKIKALVGFRYWNFNERLRFSVNSPAFNIPNEVYSTKDRFRTENNFYGGQIGLGLDWNCGDFFCNIKGKVALGAMLERVDIHGKFVTNAFNGEKSPQTFSGGYFALPSNIGHHTHTNFAVIPDVNLNLGYQVTDCASIKVGYNFLYVNNILWAGKQMKRNINPTQSPLYEFTPTPTLVGRAGPKAPHKTDSFWAHGLNVGIEYQF